MITSQEVASVKRKIYNLSIMGAVHSLESLKKNTLTRFSFESKDTQQWIADQWFGRTSKKSYQDVVAALTN